MTWVRRELQELGIPPLKRFGQHFLMDTQARARLIEVSELTPADIVLEVGPGLGFLTRDLTLRAGRVIAIEKDRTLAEHLRRKFAHCTNLTIIEGDALKTRVPEHAKIVSSPPYNISSKLILLISNSRFSLAALLLQKEFAERIIAPSGSRDYGRLTVMFQSKAQANLVEKIPRNSFYPKPRVESAIVTMRPARGPRITDPALFEDVVRTLFTQRRRRLSGVVKRFLRSRFPTQHELIFERIQVPEKRVYETTLTEFADLSNEIAKSQES